jgi:predicted kinase
MLKVILTVGIPASSKSTWAKAEIAKDPDNWVRINNDDVRQMCNGSVYSADYEKIISETRDFLIRTALKHDKNVISDNLNIGKRNWEIACKIAKDMNKDITVSEKVFYISLEEALARDAKRTGSAQVGEKAIKHWWGKTGKEKFSSYESKVEVFAKRDFCLDAPFTPAIQNENADKAIISDLDGTLALFVGKRSPYDATNCDVIDKPNLPVVETIKLFNEKGYKILFCSGREDKHRDATIRFIEKHLPGIEYELYMRSSNDFRKDSVIKEEIFSNYIKDKYNVLMVLDDRSSVCQFWRGIGLTCFQVAPGDF